MIIISDKSITTKLKSLKSNNDNFNNSKMKIIFFINHQLNYKKKQFYKIFIEFVSAQLIC